MSLPSIIFFINADISPITQLTLKNQLMIDEIMSDTEFHARVSVDPNYPIVVHLNDLRILVICQNLRDLTNRDLADIVLFIKQGQATVLKNNLGPPTISTSIERINIFNLIENIKNRTFSCRKCRCCCNCCCFKHLPAPLQKMLIYPFDPSGVHDANCDNEYNNNEFINRK